MVGRLRLFRQLYGKSMTDLWIIKNYKGKQIPKPNPPASLPHPHVFMYRTPFPIRRHPHPPFTPFPVVGSRQEAEPQRQRAVSRWARAAPRWAAGRDPPKPDEPRGTGSRCRRVSNRTASTRRRPSVAVAGSRGGGCGSSSTRSTSIYERRRHQGMSSLDLSVAASLASSPSRWSHAAPWPCRASRARLLRFLGHSTNA